MFDELWSEIADAPGEIFDVIEYKEEWEKEEKFNVDSYINSNYDYWNESFWTPRQHDPANPGWYGH